MGSWLICNHITSLHSVSDRENNLCSQEEGLDTTVRHSRELASKLNTSCNIKIVYHMLFNFWLQLSQKLTLS